MRRSVWLLLFCHCAPGPPMCMELTTPGTYEWDEIQEMLADPLVLKRPCEEIFAEWEDEREASELGEQEGQE